MSEFIFFLGWQSDSVCMVICCVAGRLEWKLEGKKISDKKPGKTFDMWFKQLDWGLLVL